MKRKLLAPLLLALCITHGASAAFFQGHQQLQQAYDAGFALNLHMGVQLHQAQDLSSVSLEALNGLQPPAGLTLTMHQLGAEEVLQARLTLGTATVLDMLQTQGGEQPLVQISGRAYTAPRGQDPLAPLLDADAPLALQLPGDAWAQALSGNLPAAFDPLKAHAQPVREGRTIKHVGTAARQVRYQLEGERWAALWPGFSKAWLDALLQPGPAHTAAQGALSGLRFEGRVDLRQYLNREGQPLGWQFIGTVLGQDDSPMKVTLLTGYAEGKGLFISLRGQQKGGADSLSAQVAVRQRAEKTRRTLEGDAVWSWREGKRQDSGKARLQLTARDTAEGETLKGAFTLDLPKLDSWPRRVTRLQPDLLYAQQGLSGTVALSMKEAGQDALEMTLSVSMAALMAPAPTLSQPAVNPHALSEQALAQEKATLEQALLAPLKALMLSLPQAQRLALMHDMGRTARTQGDPVAPLDSHQVIGDTPQEEDIP